MIYSLFKKILFLFDPEFSHKLALNSLFYLNKIGLERNKITGEQLFDEETRYFNLCKKEI